jgi:LPS sulfotransferase NodH
VFITRRDRLRQSVSWVRALQTLEWAAQDGPRAEREAVFDPEHITRKLGRIEREEQAWEALFERHGLAPHRVVYEDFVEAQEATVRQVLEAVGVEAPPNLDLPPPVLDRQADELSDEWIQRYRAEARP